MINTITNINALEVSRYYNNKLGTVQWSNHQHLKVLQVRKCTHTHSRVWQSHHVFPAIGFLTASDTKCKWNTQMSWHCLHGKFEATVKREMAMFNRPSSSLGAKMGIKNIPGSWERCLGKPFLGAKIHQNTPLPGKHYLEPFKHPTNW